MSKRKLNKILAIILSCFLFIIVLFFIYFGKLLIEGVIEHATFSREQIQEQREEVELFFNKKGYEINIIGAHTNGREHEGPFSYGWRWNSFEVDSDVVMLYHYKEKEEIAGYLEELDEDTLDKCYLSKNFLFYYSGIDEDIIITIEKFCVTSK